MSVAGTAAYVGERDLPPLVRRAIDLAQRLDFEYSCRPEQGRLLSLLARGRASGVIGETGTGCGVGLAWMVDAVDVDTRLISVEHDQQRADAAAALFASYPNVTVVAGDWRGLRTHGPFDLLVLDGGGHGKADGEMVEPRTWLANGGTAIVDDLTPMSSWPPQWECEPDLARLRWLEHPDLLATEVRLAPDLATLIAQRRG
jgi:predicted O-methyltransferase YrrM